MEIKGADEFVFPMVSDETVQPLYPDDSGARWSTNNPNMFAAVGVASIAGCAALYTVYKKRKAVDSKKEEK